MTDTATRRGFGTGAGTPRKYMTNAERQRAYRQRKKIQGLKERYLQARDEGKRVEAVALLGQLAAFTGEFTVDEAPLS